MTSGPGPVQLVAGVPSSSLRVEFSRCADRYGHQVVLSAGPEQTALLSSIEGDSGTDWPPSPPFQELSVEQHGEKTVALLVGMSGKSHWSASVETARHRTAIVFDVALLVRQTPQILLSTYRLDVPAELQSDQEVILRTSAAEVRIAVLASGDQPPPRLAIEPNQLMLYANFNNQQQWPTTVRWRYQIHSCLDAPGQ